ncbi:MAG: RnfABCDGE type electron transport complex subunit G [Dysgonomonas sp.]|nr:RnfABCDGE type electron transport complex subunit G [Dysgonomonas sp.]
MAKLKSSLLNMFLSLFIISIVAAAVLAFVNIQTSPSIIASKKQKLENAIQEVVPGFDNSPLSESYKLVSNEGDSLTIYPAKKSGELIGIAIESATMSGFSGEIRIIVGLTPQGKIIDYAVLQHAETPGLGDKMDPWFRTEKNNQNILGRDLSQSKLSVSKDGGDVDAITAATISSRAFLDAVNKAYATYSNSK